jgi:hypothetical protein
MFENVVTVGRMMLISSKKKTSQGTPHAVESWAKPPLSLLPYSFGNRMFSKKCNRKNNFSMVEIPDQAEYWVEAKLLGNAKNWGIDRKSS